LQPFVSLGDILNVFSLSVVPYLAATLFPAWRGATTEATDAIEYIFVLEIQTSCFLKKENVFLNKIKFF